MGCSQLSIECTPPSLVSISSSPLPLSAKLCSMSVHRSVQELEIYCIISRPVPISVAGSIIGRAVVGCPSNVHSQDWCVSASSPSPLFAKLCFMSVHRSVEDLEIYRIIGRPVAGGIFGRAVVGCPSNAHLQVWCLSACLNHL